MNHQLLDPSGYFSALFHYSRVNACIQMNTEGIIQCINPAFKASFGYEDADVEGKHFSILFTDEDRSKGKPAVEIMNVLKSGQADDKNFIVHKNKTISWVSGESVLVVHENGGKSLLKIIQDIHEEKDFENSLSRANRFNETILNAIDDFVIILDTSMTVLKHNPAFARLFKHDSQGPISDFATFIKPFDTKGELEDQIVQVIKKGKPFSKQVVEINTPAGERVFDISCQAIPNKETEQLVLLTGHDVTVQKRADLEREDLMGFVAHELRNPLASIMMGNDLMSVMVDQGKPEDISTLLESNRKNIDRLNKMVAELYNATRLTGGNFVLNVVEFDFDSMVAEAVDSFRVLQPAHTFTIEGKADRMVKGDAYRLQQVVSNYLSNAIKYSGGELDIRITVSVNSDKNITVAVADKGAGIAAEQMPYLFERFFRAEKTRELEGMGMGLYLCRRILQAHGGRVWAESQDGHGSVFYFSLPIS